MTPSASAPSVPGSGCRCQSATRAVRLRNGSITIRRAPRLRASRMKRHRCGAVESGFQPHTTIVRACTHSSGSTSGEAPLVAIVPAAPALAQIVRTSVEPPSASISRLPMTSPCRTPWVPR